MTYECEKGIMLPQHLLGHANSTFSFSIRLWVIRACSSMLEVIFLAKLAEPIGGELWSVIAHNFVWYSPSSKDVLGLVNYCIAGGTGHVCNLWKSRIIVNDHQKLFSLMFAQVCTNLLPYSFWKRCCYEWFFSLPG